MSHNVRVDATIDAKEAHGLKDGCNLERTDVTTTDKVVNRQNQQAANRIQANMRG